MSNPRPQSFRKIGIFGGTFDPVHVGHIVMASEARFVLDLDIVLFVPAGSPPHKRDYELAPNEDRWAMLEMVIGDRAEYALSDLDIREPGPSYTVTLLERARERYPKASLFFILGGDSLRDLPNWNEPHRIPGLATIVCVNRPDVTVDENEILRLIPEVQSRIEFIDGPLIDVSSTDIRHRTRSGAPIWGHVPDNVAAYIRTRRLYQRSGETKTSEDVSTGD
ncbi:nicotinate-nucleotide adenylyltransferase [soil metagenome]